MPAASSHRSRIGSCQPDADAPLAQRQRNRGADQAGADHDDTGEPHCVGLRCVGRSRPAGARSLRDIQPQRRGAAQVHVLHRGPAACPSRCASSAARRAAWRRARRSRPRTAAAPPGSPSLRAASAGNSAFRSGVAVKMTLMTSSVLSSLRFITSVTSSAVPARISARSLPPTWTAPRTARTATCLLLPARDSGARLAAAPAVLTGRPRRTGRRLP